MRRSTSSSAVTSSMHSITRTSTGRIAHWAMPVTERSPVQPRRGRSSLVCASTSRTSLWKTEQRGVIQNRMAPLLSCLSSAARNARIRKGVAGGSSPRHGGSRRPPVSGPSCRRRPLPQCSSKSRRLSRAEGPNPRRGGATAMWRCDATRESRPAFAAGSRPASGLTWFHPIPPKPNPDHSIPGNKLKTKEKIYFIFTS